MEANRGPSPFIRAVTEFIFTEDMPQQADVIFVPGCGHPEHVLRAAALYRAGYAPYILPAGLHGIAKDRFDAVPGFDSEWAWMRQLLMDAGVPENAILREDRSLFTWENAQFSRRTTDALGLHVEKALLCCRAFHARRALLYYQAAFPETEILVCPAQTAGLGRSDWYCTAKGRARVLGEVRRLGDQVNEVFEMMMARESERADDR